MRIRQKYCGSRNYFIAYDLQILQRGLFMLTVFAAILFYILFVVAVRKHYQKQVQAQKVVIQRRRQTHQEY